MRLHRSIALLLAFAVSPALAQSPEAIADLAPTGKLRAAINFGNGVLAQKGADGAPRGVSVELAAELAKRLGVPVSYDLYEAAGKVFEGAKAGAFDVGFIAMEPVRAEQMTFTAPYLTIDGTYMVRKDSTLQFVGDVDRPGVTIAVGLGSAYDLYLTRTVKSATLKRAPTGGGSAMIEMFLRDGLDVAAGVRQALEAYAVDHPDMRVMTGHFQEIRQAMGMPRVEGKPRAAGSAYLAEFVEEMKASGFVAAALARSGQTATVAPAAK